MRVLVVADVHANIEAFDAVLADAGDVDATWSLGDLIGYGPDPGACIARLRSLQHIAVAGNHDLAAAGAIGTEEFNPYAADAAHWTASQLSDAERDWILGLPRVATQDRFTLVHGSLRDPVWEYLIATEAIAAHLLLQETTYGFAGHTHLPAVHYEPSKMLRPAHGDVIELDERKLVANPGSVGQPRDGDPRAAYAVLDTDGPRIEFRRVAYDFAKTQAKIVTAGLPAFLADRLAYGR